MPSIEICGSVGSSVSSKRPNSALKRPNSALKRSSSDGGTGSRRMSRRTGSSSTDTTSLCRRKYRLTSQRRRRTTTRSAPRRSRHHRYRARSSTLPRRRNTGRSTATTTCFPCGTSTTLLWTLALSLRSLVSRAFDTAPPQPTIPALSRMVLWRRPGTPRTSYTVCRHGARRREHSPACRGP